MKSKRAARRIDQKRKPGGDASGGMPPPAFVASWAASYRTSFPGLCLPLVMCLWFLMKGRVS
jgi:hypothetical protein